MKIKVSDYIVDFFYKNGINSLFTITGGFAMHLNDSFGKHQNYDIYYQFATGEISKLPNYYCKPTKSTGKAIQPTIKYCDDCSSILECLACLDHRLVVGISK